MPLSSVLGAQSLVRPGVCTSSTRPASPFEGQTIYETDTDRLATWDGSAWIPYVRQTAGIVLQVVSTTKTDTFSTNNATFTDVTGLSASITPTSTSNKILVLATVALGVTPNASTQSSHYKLLRDSTDIFIGDAANNRVRASGTMGVNATGFDIFYGLLTSHISHLDSPASVSSLTYKVQIRTGNSATTAYVNRSGSDSDTTAGARVPSSITLMEISG